MSSPPHETIISLRKLHSEKEKYDPDDYEILRVGFLDLLDKTSPASIIIISIIGSFFLLSIFVFILGVRSSSWWNYLDPAFGLGLGFMFIFGWMLYGHITEYLKNRNMSVEERKMIIKQLFQENLISDVERDKLNNKC